MEHLEKFIIKAKLNGWVGAEPGGKKISSSRMGSLDITFEDDHFFYQDSFVGISDFCGHESVCFKNEPVWSQAYYGHIVRADIFDGQQTVEILRAALSAMYREGRFLGPFEFQHGQYQYRDTNQGNFKNFSGQEEILHNDIVVYRLLYFGGLVRK